MHSDKIRKRLSAVLMRAGTSKGLFLRQDDLPADREGWAPILLASMGSPDPFGKQLDGIGGGTSTTSKIAVVGRSTQPGVDVDYTFVAVPLGEARLDFTGNCGNMASGVGPFAVEEGMIPRLSGKSGQVTVSFRNTNTGVIMRSTFEIQHGVPVENGTCNVDGVANAGAPVRLDFLQPAGSMTGKLLPTGNAQDVLEVPGVGRVPVTLVDAANPFVLVHAQSVGCTGHEAPNALVPLTASLMAIRCAGAVAMGLAPTVQAAALVAGTPKLAIVGVPHAYTTPSGRQVLESDMDLHIRSFSMGQPHSSLQMTGAVCIAAACAVPGSIPNLIVERAGWNPSLRTPLRIGHGSGIIETQSETVLKSDGSLDVKRGSVYRTARRLFEGSVYYMAEVPAPPPKLQEPESRVLQSPPALHRMVEAQLSREVYV